MRVLLTRNLRPLSVALLALAVACAVLPQAHAQPDPKRTFVSSDGEVVTFGDDLRPLGEQRFTDEQGNTSIVLPGSAGTSEKPQAAFQVALPFVRQGDSPGLQSAGDEPAGTRTFGRPEPSFVIGSDDRTQVTDTTVSPYRFTVLLKVTLPGDRTGYCSGWLYAPDMVATAGHCLYDGGWATALEATVAANGATKPFPSCDVAKTYVLQSYITTPSQEDDFGAARLLCGLGARTGWFGMEVMSTADLLLNPSVALAGYPCDKIDSAHPNPTQWLSKGNITAFGPDLLEYSNDMVGCQSGSPVYDIRTSSPCFNCVVSINEAGITTGLGDKFNNGVRLSQRVYDALISMRDRGAPAATQTAAAIPSSTPTRTTTQAPLTPTLTRTSTTVAATATPTKSAAPATPTSQPGGQRYYQIDGATSVYLEAEQYSQLAGAFRVVSNTSRSAGAYADTPDKSGNDGTTTYLTYRVDVTKDTMFTLWLLSTGQDASSDSFNVALDSGAPQAVTTGSAGTWTWKKASTSLSLPSGQHTLFIRVREDGAAVDKIALMLNGATPSGLGEAALQPLYR